MGSMSSRSCILHLDGLPDGNYTLQSTTNSKHIVHEDCYGDNIMWTGLRIHGNTVTEINVPWIPEDRLSLNPSNVTAVQISSRWKVVDGSHWILDFDQKRTAAERAVSVIKHYGLSHVCFVGRPTCGDVKPMMCWLTSSNVAPSGAMAGEDAIPFDLDSPTLAARSRAPSTNAVRSAVHHFRRRLTSRPRTARTAVGLVTFNRNRRRLGMRLGDRGAPEPVSCKQESAWVDQQYALTLSRF